MDAGVDAGPVSICGDGAVTGLESCDDGARLNGDGCSSLCAVETGHFCQLPPPGQPSTCEPNCGDSRLVGNEPCDDGNFRNNDGCSSTCMIESGYSCTGEPSVCTVTCGDRVLGGLETCDDGNTMPNDGCSATCRIEPGYSCIPGASASLCRPVCGDGQLVGTEICDDGFTDDCGSCNANCTANGSGSSCGDGMRCAQTEQCDDNNMTSGDGCSATCMIDVVDAGTPLMDAGTISDAGTPPMDAGVPDAGGGTPGNGAFAYQRITNITYQDDFTRVAWHPSGRFALILGTVGKVIKYDATTRALSLVQSLGTSLADLEASPDGTYFLIVGLQSTTSHLWRINVGANDALAAATDLGTMTGTVMAISREAGTSRFAMVTRGNPSINYLYLWTSAGLSAPKTYNASGGAMSLMWGAPSLYAGSANVITGDGVNGADSRSWIEASNLIVGNNWSPGFGNPTGGAWQPGGGWGAFCGWSSDKLYVYDGAWSLLTLPGVNNGISPQSLAFRADGQRGLVVGRPSGNPLQGTVIEYRANGSATATAADFSNVSIQNFNLSPWFGSFNTSLTDVAWRPGSCDEGLIVGMDNGTVTSPTFGVAIRFYDTGQSQCVP